MNSGVYKAVSSANDTERVVEETKQTSFMEKIDIQVRDVGKFRLPIYERNTDSRAHITAFYITFVRAHFSEKEKEAGLCKLFADLQNTLVVLLWIGFPSYKKYQLIHSPICRLLS